MAIQPDSETEPDEYFTVELGIEYSSRPILISKRVSTVTIIAPGSALDKVFSDSFEP